MLAWLLGKETAAQEGAQMSALGRSTQPVLHPVPLPFCCFGPLLLPITKEAQDNSSDFEFWSQTTSVQIPALTAMCCVTLGKKSS